MRQVHGLLLSRVDYGESDLILHFFTEELGHVACMARGARKANKRFGGVLEALHTLQLGVEERARSELLVLKEASLERARVELMGQLSSLEAAGKALNWVKKLLPPRAPEPELYVSLERLLDELCSRPERSEVLLLGFGMRLLALLGWKLELELCVVCGRSCPSTGSAFTSPEKGGLVCRACGGGPYILSAEQRAYLELASGSEWYLLEDSPTEKLGTLKELLVRALLAHAHHA